MFCTSCCQAAGPFRKQRNVLLHEVTRAGGRAAVILIPFVSSYLLYFLVQKSIVMEMKCYFSTRWPTMSFGRCISRCFKNFWSDIQVIHQKIRSVIMIRSFIVKLRKLKNCFWNVFLEPETNNCKSDQHYTLQFSHLVSDWFSCATLQRWKYIQSSLLSEFHSKNHRLCNIFCVMVDMFCKVNQSHLNVKFFSYFRHLYNFV